MTKRHAMKSTVFGVIWLVVLALVGECVPARADVFRASVAPRPVADSAPAKVPAKKSEAKQSVSSSTKKAAASSKQAAAAVTKTQAKPSGSAAAKRLAPPSKSVKQSAGKAESPKALRKTSTRTTRKNFSPPPVDKQSRGTRPSKSARKPLSTTAESGSSSELHLNVKSALLINMSNGRIYFEQNPDKTIAPASITKLLTLYLVREAMAQGRLSAMTPIPVGPRAIMTGGSSMSLRRGERVPLNELIKGISVVSANNACVAVAEYLGRGDTTRFVAQMNEKARALGMTQSRFRNPNGLPAPGQLSTARDIAKLSMAYLRTFPDSLSVHSMTTHTYHGATHRNANSLLRTYPGVDGLKTGFVCSSGYNITATAKRGNTRLLAVVMGAQSATIRQIETSRLLDYGFKRAAADQNDATLARN